MRLNPANGNVLMGIAGGVTSVNGARPAALLTAVGGDWGWLSTAVIVGPADFGAGYRIWTYDTGTTVLTQVDPSDWNVFKAGGGVWAAFIAGTGVRSSVSGFGPLPLAGLAGISEDGEFAIIQNYQADGGLQIFNAAGSAVAAWTTTLTGLPVTLHDSVISYQDAAGWHLRSLTTGALIPYAPRTVGTTYQVIPVRVGSVLYVVEWVNETLTLRPATTSNGYVVVDHTSAPNTLFNPDAITFVANTIRIGYSVTAGENPTDARLVDVTLGSGASSTGTTTSGSLVVTAAPAIPSSTMPVGPITGGTGASAAFSLLYRHPLVTPDRIITQEWYRAWQQIATGMSAAVDLGSGTTGTVPPSQGGTGAVTGLTVLNASNLMSIAPPMVVAPSGYWSPLTNGDPVTPAIIFDSFGDVVVTFTPTI